MHFKFRIDSDRLEEILRAIEVIHDTILMKFTSEGISIIVVDVANVAMVKATIPTSTLKNYEADETEFGFTFDALLSSLQAFKKYNIIEELTVFQDDAYDDGAMIVRSNNITQSFPRIAPDELRKRPKWITLDLPASANILMRDFVVAMEILNHHYDYIKTTITTERILSIIGHESSLFKRSSDFNGKIKFEKTNSFGSCGAIETVVAAPTEVTTHNSMDYIIDIARTIKDCGMIKITLGHELPIILSATLPKSEATVEYMIAPRVENV